ncbi:20485_t:CDS:2 [Gigaspora margarita]|uniref:20485_t:CDS:1 n=1 Tax=Gigaspora margarita TaxID=4874 RepID=A0ABN7V5R3_GIGMA|nr:20485_t:CDS:2 [Gigaspora margarita]
MQISDALDYWQQKIEPALVVIDCRARGIGAKEFGLVVVKVDSERCSLLRELSKVFWARIDIVKAQVVVLEKKNIKTGKLLQALAEKKKIAVWKLATIAEKKMLSMGFTCKSNKASLKGCKIDSIEFEEAKWLSSLETIKGAISTVVKAAITKEAVEKVVGAVDEFDIWVSEIFWILSEFNLVDDLTRWIDTNDWGLI